MGDSPGPAGYLSNPVYLDGRGRQLYEKPFISQLRQFEAIEGKVNVEGRIQAL